MCYLHSSIFVLSLQLKVRCPRPTPQWVFQSPTWTTPVPRVLLSNWCVAREVPPYTKLMSWGTPGSSRPTVTSTVQVGRAHAILTLMVIPGTSYLQGCILDLQSRTSGWFWRMWPTLTRVATAVQSLTSRWNINTVPSCRNPTTTFFSKLHHVRTSNVWVWRCSKLVYGKKWEKRNFD